MNWRKITEKMSSILIISEFSSTIKIVLTSVWLKLHMVRIWKRPPESLPARFLTSELSEAPFFPNKIKVDVSPQQAIIRFLCSRNERKFYKEFGEQLFDAYEVETILCDSQSCVWLKEKRWKTVFLPFLKSNLFFDVGHKGIMAFLWYISIHDDLPDFTENKSSMQLNIGLTYEMLSL